MSKHRPGCPGTDHFLSAIAYANNIPDPKESLPDKFDAVERWGLWVSFIAEVSPWLEPHISAIRECKRDEDCKMPQDLDDGILCVWHPLVHGEEDNDGFLKAVFVVGLRDGIIFDSCVQKEIPLKEYIEGCHKRGAEIVFFVKRSIQ